MDDQGVVTKTISDEGLRAVATIIVRGIKDGDLNTRSLNTVRSPRFTRLIAELKEATEAASRESKSEPTNRCSSKSENGSKSRPVSVSGSRSTPSGSASKQREKQPSSTSVNSKEDTPKPLSKKSNTRFLPVGHLIVPSQYPVAVRLHLEELSALNIKKFPNTAFLALRALLEKSIKAYAEAKEIDIRSSGNNIEGYVQLHHALKWFGEYVKENGPRRLVQPVTRLRTGKLINYTATNDALNAINHNHHFSVDPDEVVNCWQSIDSIMRELMKP